MDRHRQEVWRLLVASVGPEQAEDCFQETFISALRAYPGIKPESDLRAWVLTIAHRKALDAHRSRARAALPMSEPPAASNGQPVLPAQERDERLWQAVARLPRRQRSAVVLRCVGDLPHSEIAAALGCSQEAARRSFHEGLSKLRKTMTHD